MYIVEMIPQLFCIFKRFFTETQLFKLQTPLSLPFKLFQAVFENTYSHGCSGGKLCTKMFNQFDNILRLRLWFPIFIHDSLTLKQTKRLPMNMTTSLLLYCFSKLLLIITSDFQWTLNDLCQIVKTP